MIRSANDDAFFVNTHICGRDMKQLLDSGADRELVGKQYAIKNNIKIKKLKEPVGIRYMDGKSGKDITHATWQLIKVPGTNGTRTFRVKYLVADIPEGWVLGHNWLKTIDPIINWQAGNLTWRKHTPFQYITEDPLLARARRARKQIIQSSIQANQAPDWVQKEFPQELIPRTSGVPPHRGELDYKIQMKPDWKPKREPNRSFSPEERRMFVELEKMNKELWRIGNGPQAVQMLWAAKAGGEKRPCHDYRPLNIGIVDDGYPIPPIKDLMTDIMGCEHITSLDLPKAYNEVRVADKETEDLLAFYCNGKLYAPRVMQFGSKTAVSHYQRFITTILGDVIGQGVHAYLDNIVVFAKTREKHDELLRKVLTRLGKAHLAIQPRKCEWDKSEVQFCGFLVGKEGLRLDPAKLQAIRDWPEPHKGPNRTSLKTQVREFVGFCNYYRGSVEGYSEIAAPLTTLQSPSARWEWGERERTSWKMLKLAIMSAPVLAAYDERLPIEAHTDASNTAYGATIEQRYDCGHTLPIAFMSGKFSQGKENWATHDKELFAIVQLFKQHRSWLHGSPGGVTVWTDHSALKHFLTTTKLTQKHARWAQMLGEFSIVIKHVPGRANKAADALSRQGEEQGPVGRELSPLKEEHFAKQGSGEERGNRQVSQVLQDYRQHYRMTRAKR
jgi:hypothetical protein